MSSAAYVGSVLEIRTSQTAVKIELIFAGHHVRRSAEAALAALLFLKVSTFACIVSFAGVVWASSSHLLQLAAAADQAINPCAFTHQELWEMSL